jgi:glycosyltransferase involved in cell wall biosynthesis
MQPFGGVMAERFVVGSEVQHFEGISILSGIQRVVREAHVGLSDRLRSRGIDLVPLHTQLHRDRSAAFRELPYRAADPVLQQSRKTLLDIDLCLLLDLNREADFPTMLRHSRAVGVPMIALIHDIIPLLEVDRYSSMDRLQFRLYLQQLLLLADDIVVTSEKVKSDLERLNWKVRGTIQVLRLGSTFKPRPANSESTNRMSVLYVSTLRKYKGHAGLLQAFDLLRATDIDIDLTFIGQLSEPEHALADAIRSHPDFGGRLRWIESANDVLLTTIAGECTIGAFPSEEEGFGLFLEEGLALGLKMVVNDLPVFRERAQDNVTYFSRSPEALAEALMTAHANAWKTPDVPGRTMSDFHDDLAELIMRRIPTHLSP